MNMSNMQVLPLPIDSSPHFSLAETSVTPRGVTLSIESIDGHHEPLHPQLSSQLQGSASCSPEQADAPVLSETKRVENTRHQLETQNAMEGQSATPTPEDRVRYETARKELIQTLQKKRAVDKQLAQLEVQIYNFEGNYLTETTAHSGGNIIQGFDTYLKTQNVGRRRHEVTDADRMFSSSSLTYQKSLELVGEGDDGVDDGPGGSIAMGNSVGNPGAGSSGGSRGPTPGLTTVVLPPPSTRAPQELTAAQQKKMRDKEYQRRKRANAANLRNSLAAAAAAANPSSTGASGSGASGQNGEDFGESPQATSSTGVRGTARRPNKRPRPADDD